MKRTYSLFQKFYIRICAMAFALITALSLSGCEGSLNPLDINLFSASDDVKLGMQLDAEIRSKPGEYPILNMPSAQQYVQAMCNDILNSPLIKYKGVFEYKVQIIRDDNTVNAFAAPGGYLYFYTGLLKFVDNEATLAGVIAHEIAHAELRHSTKRLTKAYGATLLLGIILGNNPSKLEEIAANLLTGLAFLKNSRDDEYEADEYAFKYLQSTVWYPGGIKYFFNKIGENSGSSFLETLLSTHPLPPDRIAAVDKLIADANLPAPSESNLFSERYRNFKNSLP